MIRTVPSVSEQISTRSARDAVGYRSRRHFLSVALCVAALANVLVPALFFSETRLFGPTEPHYRVLLAAVVVAEYAIAYLLLLVHANVGFASGYSVATAAQVTLGSAMLAYSTLDSSGWDWSARYWEVLTLAGFALAVFSNIAFLIASVRYARAIHPRLHRRGFFLGIITSFALLYLYARVLS